MTATSMKLLAVLVLIALGMGFGHGFSRFGRSVRHADDDVAENRVEQPSNFSSVLQDYSMRMSSAVAAQEANAEGLETTGEVSGASCYDSRMSSIINSGLNYYSHDMAQLVQYILQQIQKAGYKGAWLVHAQDIMGHPQGPEWQSVTNGDLFAPRSTHGCYYHDTRTYITIVRYY